MWDLQEVIKDRDKLKAEHAEMLATLKMMRMNLDALIARVEGKEADDEM